MLFPPQPPYKPFQNNCYLSFELNKCLEMYDPSVMDKTTRMKNINEEINKNDSENRLAFSSRSTICDICNASFTYRQNMLR